MPDLLHVSADPRCSPVLKAVRIILVLISLLAAGQGVVFAQGAQGYGGPSILSRGGNAPGRRGRAPVDFTFYASLRGLYETGLLAPVLNENGELVPRDTSGGQAEIGAYGGHDWRRSSLGLDYRGDYRYTTGYKNLNGMNHALALDYSYQLNRRTQIQLRETGGTSNRAFGGFAAPAFSDAGALGLPLNELFDVRIYYAQSTANVLYRKSARMTLIGGVTGFFVKRKSLALVNAQGYTANGGVSYQLNRRDTVGVEYTAMRLEFPHVFLHSNVQSAGLRFQRRFSRSLEVELFGGAYRISTAGTQTVQLSPEVAAILGRSTGRAFFRKQDYLPNLQAGVSYLQEHGRYYLRASKTIGAGNGIFLTSARTGVHGGYSYQGIRRASLGASAGWTRMNSVALQLGNITSWQAGAGFSYKLGERLNFTSQFDRRSFDSTSTAGRQGFAASVGLSYSSSHFPLSIW